LAKGLLGEASDPEFEVLRNYAVILSNTTEKTVVAFDVRWEYTDADGRRIPIDARDGRVGWLTGGPRYAHNKLTHSPVLPAYSSTIMMPIVGFRKATTTSKRASDPRHLEDLRDSISGLGAGSDIVATLDGAFFADGSFVGPDRSGFFTAFQAELTARQNLAAFILQAVQGGRDMDDVAKEIEATYLSAPPETREAPYADGSDGGWGQFYRFWYAQQFLNAYHAGGKEAGLGWARQNFFQHVPQLTKTATGGL
jgi:hypothetical protein